LRVRWFLTGDNALHSDFTANDEWGLATNQNRGGGDQNASSELWEGFYDGKIALLREFRSAFGAAEAQQNFAAATVPEPSTAALAGLLITAAGLRFRGRTE
jgi:hypothetical protein